MRLQGNSIRHLLNSRAIPSTSSVIARRVSTSSTTSTQFPVRTALYTTLFAVSTGLFAVYYFDARSAIHRYVLTPVLRYTFDAETGHKIAVKVLRSGLGPRDPVRDNVALRSELWGEEISNPVGLAAGFDKDAEAVDGLFDLGFSWVEIGSVTPKPQPGNARPRVFHLPDDTALINRYGFPSQGATSVLSRLRARIPTFYEPEDKPTASLRPGNLLAVNLGKNKESPVESADDFVAGVKMFGPYADVLVVNVSSPNTPGLRGLQNRDLLEDLLANVVKTRDELPPSPITLRRPRLILKIAPDLDEHQLIEIGEVVRQSDIDGVIVSNTTIRRPSGLTHPNKSEAGGLSGVPLKPHSLLALKTLRAQLPSTIPLIGCGGITNGADALEFAKAGASLVQVYTGFGYDGAGTCRRIKDELCALLESENTTWNSVVQDSVAKTSWKPLPPPVVKSEEVTIEKLVQEAQELKTLLDGLGERMGDNIENPLAGEGESTATSLAPVS
ncbi:Dihydroorotate dehydrogenase-domain-containing protein [Hygrophoropsis aurantiaca]|uniref:Dihydroorotate dehydrogenase-domain-containing protein n=1 Tax=Hygrophoropsis aurantiaca TaxID=72124 RepID=A0ACB8AIF5_9AGAM|nr:Dihydroorotate dehydrogenase-domain-containing protein [Hygrophoropsis aurantiaca]